MRASPQPALDPQSSSHRIPLTRRELRSIRASDAVPFAKGPVAGAAAPSQEARVFSVSLPDAPGQYFLTSVVSWHCAVNLKDREFGWRAALLIVGRLPSSGKGIGMALRSALSRRKDRGGYALDSGSPYRLWFGLATGRVDNPLVRGGINRHGLLHEPEEKSTPTLGSPPVEAKGELVQVVIKVLLADRSLVGAQQPPLEEGDYAIDPRQQLRGSLLLAFEDRDLVVITAAFQGEVSRPAVGVHDAAGCYRRAHERYQALAGSVDDRRIPMRPIPGPSS